MNTSKKVLLLGNKIDCRKRWLKKNIFGNKVTKKNNSRAKLSALKTIDISVKSKSILKVVNNVLHEIDVLIYT